MFRYSVIVSAKTRKGVVVQHQYILNASSKTKARQKALRRAWWRFPFCGLVVTEVTYE